MNAVRRAIFPFLLALIPLFGFGMGGARPPRACARPAASNTGRERAPCCPQPVKDCCRYSQPYTAIAATSVEPAQRGAAAFAILVPAPSPFFSADDRAAPVRPGLHPPSLPRTPLILPLRI